MTTIENALESIEQARQEILLIDPTPKEKAKLDAAYASLKRSAELLEQLAYDFGVFDSEIGAE
ncbi:MAG: hypothetical protein SGI77_00780 [Pirellulaceae bacterium]|nr:hypothetical protein [Pirellulaceae bacterium]